MLHNFEAESGAKVRQKFQTAKFFSNFFFNLYFKNLCASGKLVCFSDCGCKGSALFLNCKLSRIFFQIFFSLFSTSFYNLLIVGILYKRPFRTSKSHYIYINIGIPQTNNISSTKTILHYTIPTPQNEGKECYSRCGYAQKVNP